MKLSFACTLATIISVVAFVAIFAMTALIYDKVVTDPATRSVAEANAAPRQAPQELAGNLPTVGSNLQQGNQALAAFRRPRFGTGKPTTSPSTSSVDESRARPRIPSFRNSGFRRTQSTTDTTVPVTNVPASQVNFQGPTSSSVASAGFAAELDPGLATDETRTSNEKTDKITDDKEARDLPTLELIETEQMTAEELFPDSGHEVASTNGNGDENEFFELGITSPLPSGNSTEGKFRPTNPAVAGDDSLNLSDNVEWLRSLGDNSANPGASTTRVDQREHRTLPNALTNGQETTNQSPAMLTKQDNKPQDFYGQPTTPPRNKSFNESIEAAMESVVPPIVTGDTQGTGSRSVEVMPTKNEIGSEATPNPSIVSNQDVAELLEPVTTDEGALMSPLTNSPARISDEDAPPALEEFAETKAKDDSTFLAELNVSEDVVDNQRSSQFEPAIEQNPPADPAASFDSPDQDLSDANSLDAVATSEDEATDILTAPTNGGEVSRDQEQVADRGSQSNQTSDRQSERPEVDNDIPVAQPIRKAQQAAKPKQTKAEIVGWPLPDSLMPELDQLEKFETTAEWASVTRQAFETLNEFEIGDPVSKAWLDHCEKLAEQLSQFSRNLTTSSTSYHGSAVYMAKIAYQIKRRIDIWQAVHQAAVRNVAEKPEFTGRVIAQQIGNRTREINFAQQVDPYWRDYLMLESAKEIFADPDSSPLKYRAISQKILARATSDSLNAQQLEYAQNVIGNDLAEVLRGVASGQVLLGQFLVDLEKHEATPSSGSRARLNNHFQNYYWSREPNVQEISERIDDHYRNANMRIEFSQRLINSMIPNQATSIQQPVSDRILGANVLGQSRVTNQISVQMVPDPQHLSFRLQSDGRVLSRTRAHAKGFTFNNLGNGLVKASKVIAIGQDGISTTPTSIRASSQDRLLGIQGQMDGVPILGNLTRRLAHQQQQAQGFQVKQIVEDKMGREFKSRIDLEVQKGVERAKTWFQANVLSPLHSMELEPTVVQLQTTSDAAVVRYRLAALDQIAADTPRPNSQPGSLASFQLHRSVANNITNRIHINRETFTPREFMDHLNMLLGRNDLSIPPEQDRPDVTFGFASRDAIQLDFVDGMLEITLRIKKLQIGKRSRLKNLIVTARYSPVAYGQNIALGFDEDFGLQVEGRLNVADQLTARTIFSSLFKPDFRFELLPPEVANHPAARDLVISQLILSDGWLGVSLNSPASQANENDQASQNGRPYAYPGHEIVEQWIPRETRPRQVATQANRQQSPRRYDQSMSRSQPSQPRFARPARTGNSSARAATGNVYGVPERQSIRYDDQRKSLQAAGKFYRPTSGGQPERQRQQSASQNQNQSPRYWR